MIQVNVLEYTRELFRFSWHLKQFDWQGNIKIKLCSVENDLVVIELRVALSGSMLEAAGDGIFGGSGLKPGMCTKTVGYVQGGFLVYEK